MRIRILTLMAGVLPAFVVTAPVVMADGIVPAIAAAPSPSPTASGTAPMPAASPATPSSPAPAASPATSGTAAPTVIHFEKLLPFLPAAPEGWTAEPSQGTTSETDEFKLTTVQKSYFKGTEDNAPTASLTILDFGGNQTYFDAATSAWKFSSETTEGYDKTVDLDGIRGFEHYSKAAKAGSLSTVVGKRFFVQVELTNLDPKELRDWFKKIDVKKLSELK